MTRHGRHSSPKKVRPDREGVRLPPSISGTDGKSQVALLWCEFGIRIFMDMEETVDKAALAEKKIQIARANLAACLDEYEAIRRGEA
ncbi:MAG: hypothetical protein ACLRTA_02385 [Clostridia bacterium]